MKPHHHATQHSTHAPPPAPATNDTHTGISNQKHRISITRNPEPIHGRTNTPAARDVFGQIDPMPTKTKRATAGGKGAKQGTASKAENKLNHHLVVAKNSPTPSTPPHILLLMTPHHTPAYLAPFTRNSEPWDWEVALWDLIHGMGTQYLLVREPTARDEPIDNLKATQRNKPVDQLPILSNPVV